MSSSESWIREMVERGLLTREQAEEAARQGAGPAAAPGESPAATATPASATPRQESGGLFSCSPCGKVFTFVGVDPDDLPRCPDCGGPLRAVQLGSVLAAPSPGAAGGQRFGRYQLRRELGRGGMGVVFEAFDPVLGRPVALKMLSAPGRELDAPSVERLLREARAAAKLRHPGIVAVHDIGQAEGRHYFTMDLVEGSSFDQLIKAEKAFESFPLRARVEALAAVAEALGAAHAQGIVHRDVKPSNILVDRHGVAHLVDFGLARDSAGASELTVTGVLIGTPQYMSPEQASRTAHHAAPPSDVFSLGVVLYRALTGELPFPGDEVQSLLAVLQEEPLAPTSRRADVPRDLETVCLKCLEKNPARRYPDGAALAADLRRWLAGGPVAARPVPWPTRVFRKLFRRRVAATREDLDRAEDERRRAVDRAAAQAEATKRLEQARPALDRAEKALYERSSAEDLATRVDAAQGLIEQALARSPDLALGHYLLGRAWSLKGQDARAQACWRDAIRLDPDFGPAHYQLGRLLAENAVVSVLAFLPQDRGARTAEARRQAAEAEASLMRALQLGSGFDDEAQRRLAAAMSAWLRDDLPEAARLCRESLAQFPAADGRESFHWLLSLCLEGDDRLAELDRALAIRPRFALALSSRGTLRFRNDRLDEAAADLEEALRLKPDFAPPRNARGMLRFRRGDIAGARADFEETLRLAPDSSMAWNNRALAKWSARDLPGALSDYREALARNPKYALAWANLSGVLRDLGDHDGGVRAGDEAVSLDPELVQGRVNRGLSRLGAGDVAGAVADFDEAIRRRPEHALTWYNRGTARQRIPDPEGALADFLEATRLNPSSCIFWSGLAEAQIARGDSGSARESCDRALALKPGDAVALAMRAGARGLAGDAAGAEADYALALESEPRDADTWLDRAAFRARAGRTGDAAADARRALELAPAKWRRRAEAEGLAGRV